MVIGKLPVPGRPTIWVIVGQGPIAFAVGAGGGCLDSFTLLFPFSPLSPSLWEIAILSQRATKPKTTNRPTQLAGRDFILSDLFITYPTSLILITLHPFMTLCVFDAFFYSVFGAI